MNATYRTAASGAAPLGAVIGGVVARSLGVTGPLLMGVVPLLLMAVLAGRQLQPVET